MTQHTTGTGKDWLPATTGTTSAEPGPQRMTSERAFRQAYLGLAALLFAASAALTITRSASLSAMVWMPMPGQTWAGAAASFLGMWVVMMAAMMLPSLVPLLERYRGAVARTGETRPIRLTALVGVGYFFAWTVLGIAAFPVGVALAAIEMQLPALARSAPIAVGVVVVIAGSFQLTAWKARHLASCREVPGHGHTAGRRRHGLATRPALRLPLHTLLCRPDGGFPGHWDDGPARDGGHYGNHHRRTSRVRR